MQESLSGEQMDRESPLCGQMCEKLIEMIKTMFLKL